MILATDTGEGGLRRVRCIRVNAGDSVDRAIDLMAGIEGSALPPHEERPGGIRALVFGGPLPDRPDIDFSMGFASVNPVPDIDPPLLANEAFLLEIVFTYRHTRRLTAPRIPRPPSEDHPMTDQSPNDQFHASSFMQGHNAAYLEQLYAQLRGRPQRRGRGPGASSSPPSATARRMRRPRRRAPAGRAATGRRRPATT